MNVANSSSKLVEVKHVDSKMIQVRDSPESSASIVESLDRLGRVNFLNRDSLLDDPVPCVLLPNSHGALFATRDLAHGRFRGSTLCKLL